MFQFSWFPPSGLYIQPAVLMDRISGFPHSEIPGSKPVHGSPRLIAVSHVLHRQIDAIGIHRKPLITYSCDAEKSKLLTLLVISIKKSVVTIQFVKCGRSFNLPSFRSQRCPLTNVSNPC